MNHTCVEVSPFALAGAFISARLSHAVEGLLQEVFPERLGHLSQGIHCNRTRGINAVIARPRSEERVVARGRDPLDVLCSVLTGIASVTVNALFGNVANGPVSVHKEAVAERVTQPLHSRWHAPAGRQAHLAGAAQENALSKDSGEIRWLRAEVQESF